VVLEKNKAQKSCINTLASGLVQAVCVKTAGLHVALRGNFSGPVSATDPVKISKDSASLVICTQKFFFWLKAQIFCECCHKWRTHSPPWPTSPGPGPKPIHGSI